MKPNTVAAHATTKHPNRILMVLAAAWMILSLAIGGALHAESREAASSEAATSLTIADR